MNKVNLLPLTALVTEVGRLVREFESVHIGEIELLGNTADNTEMPVLHAVHIVAEITDAALARASAWATHNTSKELYYFMRHHHWLRNASSNLFDEFECMVLEPLMDMVADFLLLDELEVEWTMFSVVLHPMMNVLCVTFEEDFRIAEWARLVKGAAKLPRTSTRIKVM